MRQENHEEARVGQARRLEDCQGEASGRSAQRRTQGDQDEQAREPKADGKLSALDAGAKALAEAAGLMTTGEMIVAMGKKGYWISPGGKTPGATLYCDRSRADDQGRLVPVRKVRTRQVSLKA